MLQGGVGRQNGVVRLNDRAGQLRGGIHTKLQFRLLAIVGGKAFHQQSAKARTSSASEGVEDEETLESRAVIRQTADLLHHGLDEFFSDSVMTASICET